MEYKYLFTPIKIGSATIKNRIFSAPHGTSFSKDNILDERYIEYQKMRAKGGVGLIIAGGKPRENLSTFTPMLFATRKCPNS